MTQDSKTRFNKGFICLSLVLMGHLQTHMVSCSSFQEEISNAVRNGTELNFYINARLRQIEYRVRLTLSIPSTVTIQ